MLCAKCGNEIPDGSKYCPNCGAKVGGSSIEKNIRETFEKVDNEVDNAVNEVKKELGGESNINGPLQTDRSLVAYILLSIITCGIYGYYFIYKLAKDMNMVCSGDEEKTPGLATYIILSFVTCGFYSIYWEYKIGNRMYANASRYGITITEDGGKVVLWRIVGMLICFVGTFVGDSIIIKNANVLCSAYNKKISNVQ